MSGLAVQLPIALDKEDGYALLKTFAPLVKQNLRTLITTSSGEKIGDPEYGVGVRQLLFYQNADQVLSVFESRLQSQAGAYMPYIELLDILVKEADSNEYISNSYMLYIHIKYRIISLDVFDVLKLEINN